MPFLTQKIASLNLKIYLKDENSNLRLKFPPPKTKTKTKKTKTVKPKETKRKQSSALLSSHTWNYIISVTMQPISTESWYLQASK